MESITEYLDQMESLNLISATQPYIAVDTKVTYDHISHRRSHVTVQALNNKKHHKLGITR